MKTFFVTGANRGIGLALVGRFLEDGAFVHAAARDPLRAEELHRLGKKYESRLAIHALDVTSDAACAALGREIPAHSIDVLVNNAGVASEWGENLRSLRYDDARKNYEVNVLGVLRTTAALEEGLKPGAWVLNVTSRMGSIADNTSGGAYGYRLAKAAQNMATKNLAIELRGSKIGVVAVHPGWVRSAMGGAGAPVEPEDCAKNIANLLAKLTPKDSGKFFHADGSELPW